MLAGPFHAPPRSATLGLGDGESATIVYGKHVHLLEAELLRCSHDGAWREDVRAADGRRAVLSPSTGNPGNG